jgi:regulator of replication initiation timing
LEAELERVRAGNAFLSEENSRLRLEVIRLNEALAEAGQTIYSLNRKLDAIFKPEAEGE